MSKDHHIWWGGMAACLFVYGVALHLNLAAYAVPLIMGGALVFIFERGERGAFPFRKRHIVRYPMNYFGFVMVLAIILNTAPHFLPSGAETVRPIYWALPMIATYLGGLYFRRTA